MPAGREQEARAFYAGLLGLAEQTKPANLVGRGGCWFALGAVKVHLGVVQDFVSAGKAHPAFIVDDLTKLRKHLKPQAAMWLRMSRWKGITGSMSMTPSVTASK